MSDTDSKSGTAAELSLRCGYCGFQPGGSASLAEICNVCHMDGYRLLPNNTTMAYFQVLRESAAPPPAEGTPLLALRCGNCGSTPLHLGVALGEICRICGIDGYRLLPLPDTGGPTDACDCGSPRARGCTDCTISEYQAAHPDCRICCQQGSVAGDLPGVGPAFELDAMREKWKRGTLSPQDVVRCFDELAALRLRAEGAERELAEVRSRHVLGGATLARRTPARP